MGRIKDEATKAGGQRLVSGTGRDYVDSVEWGWFESVRIACESWLRRHGLEGRSWE
jgi:hypothetical protein